MTSTQEAADHSIASLPGEIEREHEAFLGSARRTLAHAIECGRLLSKLKEVVGHGKWEKYAEKHLSFGARQARKYMSLYQRRERLPRHSDTDLSIEEVLASFRDMGEDDPPPRKAPFQETRPPEPEPESTPGSKYIFGGPQPESTPGPKYIFGGPRDVSEPMIQPPITARDVSGPMLSLASTASPPEGGVLPIKPTPLTHLQCALRRLEEARDELTRSGVSNEISDQMRTLLQLVQSELWRRQTQKYGTTPRHPTAG